MIIAHTADLHIDERPAPGCWSLEQQLAALRWIGRDAADHDTDLMVVAGDIFERSSTPAERLVAAKLFAEWAGWFDILLVEGNHDAPGDLDCFPMLYSPQTVRVGTPNTPGGVVPIPWPRKARLANMLPPGADVEETAAAAMRAVLAGIKARFAAQQSGPGVLVGHIELGAAITDHGQPLVGRCDIELSPEDLLDTGCDVALLGHVHRPQLIGDRISYAGSIRQTDFGEGVGKSYSVVELGGGDPKIIRRPIPGPRMRTLEVEVDDHGICGPASAFSFCAGDSLRLVYSCPSDLRATVRQQADEIKQSWLDRGAAYVKIDGRIISTTRTRSETFAKATSDEGRLRALWEAQGSAPTRAQEILTKFATLDDEC